MQPSRKAPAKATRHRGRNDTLVSSSMLKHAVQAILRRTKLDRTYDIPYLAGYSSDGRTIYIDRHLPRFCNTRARRVGVDRFLILHEAVEKALLDKLGLHYQHAHQIALRAEEAAVRAAGISWREYDQFMQCNIKDVGHEKLRRIPLDLDIKPYRDEHDTQLLKSIQKQLKREFALRHRRQIDLRN
ncbi:MAG: hypothetical protein AYP45_00620 [Candidatus Brocadia carolinensis]|uniref:Uncharacterized protein n=1 Tax=Candidatus Brocadia carolinensis TaxID=1004156 RepID=A0A1V4AXT3_9BACT|nr:MAG: hypothetical protein AYP45_00620 [Candidatus Brocadia caroliniensis]